jgi:hypothetical protein
MLRKLMLVMMLAKRKLENALSQIDHLSPQQLDDKDIIGKIRWKLSEARSMAGGINYLFSEAKTILQILEDLEKQ